MLTIHIIQVKLLPYSDDNYCCLIRFGGMTLLVNTQLMRCLNKKQHHVLCLQSSYSSHDKHLTVDFTPSSKYGFESCTQATLTLSFFLYTHLMSICVI